MRIDRLWIKRFRNLQDFEVDFDEGSARQVIVGRNGVGKSNLLEAITRIFRDLDLEERSDFGYDIEYFCNSHVIRVICDENDKGVASRGLKVYIAPSTDVSFGSPREGRAYTQLRTAEFFKRNRPVDGLISELRLIPAYVFGYYSGSITRYSSVFARHEEVYFREQITGNEAPLRTLFQAKPHHSQFTLLAFFAAPDQKVQDFLEKECRITGFNSALFALREPYWKPSLKQIQAQRRKGDARFWWAGGKVAPFLDALFRNSVAPMAGRQRVNAGIGRERTIERRFCYVSNVEALHKLAENLSNKEFFARLESLVYSDLLSQDGTDLRIWIDLKGVDEAATFSDLAEGEQQLLTVLGLLRFTAESEALFLLDEPDTHLNPAWCLDYLENLQMYGATPRNSQILMTTHSPLTFAGLKKNEVVILERESDGSIRSEHPVTDPKGMGFGAILTSDYFGLRSTLDRETLKKIDEKRMLSIKPDRDDTDRMRIAELDDELGSLDFSRAARDPLYLEFIRAMTAAQETDISLKDPAPEKSTWRERKQIAIDIATSIRRNKGGK